MENELKKVAWAIPLPLEGGGGIRTIFQNGSALEKNGFTCDYFILPSAHPNLDIEKIKRDVKAWFNVSAKKIQYLPEIPEGYDIVIATSNDTALFAKLSDAPLKLYFIQDFEPDFYPMSDYRIDALNTYFLDLKPITIGKWLSRKIGSLINEEVPCTCFGVDLDIYFPRPPRARTAVCALYQPSKERRLAKLVLEALALVHEVDPSIKLYIYGEKVEETSLPPYIENLSLLSREKTAELYNSCSLGLSFSSTNPSRIPFEMLACGLPVVEVAQDNGMYDFPEGAVSFSKPDPVSLATRVLMLMNNPGKLLNMQQEGIAFSRLYPEKLETDQFVKAVQTYLAEANKIDSYRSAVSYPINEQNKDEGAGPHEKKNASGADSSASEEKTEKKTEETLDEKVKRLYFADKKRDLSDLYYDSLPLHEGEYRLTIEGAEISSGTSTDDATSTKPDVRLAYWSETDQGNIIWTSGKIDKDKITFKVSLMPEENPLYNFHFYNIGPDGDKFLFGFASLVNNTEEAQKRKQLRVSPYGEVMAYFKRKTFPLKKKNQAS